MFGDIAGFLKQRSAIGSQSAKANKFKSGAGRQKKKEGRKETGRKHEQRLNIWLQGNNKRSNSDQVDGCFIY